MSVIILLIVLSVLMAGLFLVAYLWSTSSGQFEDLDANAFRVLYDTVPLKKPSSIEK
jgi:cbb3-type cytochrome oxidase maturation protein